MDKKFFNEQKFEYYKKMNLVTVILIGLASIGYYFSDCYLLGGMTTETLLPRMAIVVPMILFVFINKYTNNYKIIILMNYIVGHAVMWNTIWACAHLSNLNYACVGFFIVQFSFLPLGIVAPRRYAVVAQGLLFADIIIANTFLHYPDFQMMFLLGIPLYLGIIGFNAAMEKTFSDQLKMKIKLEDNLEHDRLTGVYNRNIFSQLVDEDNHFVNAGKDKIAVIMYDLDNFKKINDKYGHTAGDNVLVKVCETIKLCLLQDEVLIRWGGEEFIIILSEKNGDFMKRAEELRKTVEEMNLNVGKVTISVGLADYNGEDYKTIIKYADRALYQAKENGRNQVVRYEM